MMHLGSIQPDFQSKTQSLLKLDKVVCCHHVKSTHTENKKGVIRNLFYNEFETLSINLFGLKTFKKTSLENEDRITSVSYEPMHNFKRFRTCLRNALSTLEIC